MIKALCHHLYLPSRNSLYMGAATLYSKLSISPSMSGEAITMNADFFCDVAVQ